MDNRNKILVVDDDPDPEIISPVIEFTCLRDSFWNSSGIIDYMLECIIPGNLDMIGEPHPGLTASCIALISLCTPDSLLVN